MSEIWKRVKNIPSVVAVYYKTGGSFCAGYIEGADDEFVCMRFLSPSGKFDGWHCIRIEEILKMDVGSRYLSDLERVNRHYEEEIPPIKINPKKILSSFLDIAERKKWLCTLEIGFETIEKISGYITGRDMYSVEMKLLNEHGEEDGYTSFDVEEIVYIGAESEFEKYLKTLVELNGNETTPSGKDGKRKDEEILSFPFGKK